MKNCVFYIIKKRGKKEEERISNGTDLSYYRYFFNENDVISGKKKSICFLLILKICLLYPNLSKTIHKIWFTKMGQ